MFVILFLPLMLVAQSGRPIAAVDDTGKVVGRSAN
jgi:hypothetical protein